MSSHYAQRSFQSIACFNNTLKIKRAMNRFKKERRERERWVTLYKKVKFNYMMIRVGVMHDK